MFIVRGKLVKSGRWIKTEQTTLNIPKSKQEYIA